MTRTPRLRDFCGKRALGHLPSHPALATAPRARGLTPLHRIEVEGLRGAATIDLLLASGADINARADDGSTPLDTRESVLLEEVADLLRSRGAKPGRHAAGAG